MFWFRRERVLAGLTWRYLSTQHSFAILCQGLIVLMDTAGGSRRERKGKGKGKKPKAVATIGHDGMACFCFEV